MQIIHLDTAPAQKVCSSRTTQQGPPGGHSEVLLERGHGLYLLLALVLVAFEREGEN